MISWFKRLICFSIIFLLTPDMTEGKVHLVSVGISDYPGTSSDLDLPSKDAKIISWVYSRNSELRYCSVLLFLACRDDEYKRESRFMNNSYLTTYLQKGLRGGADMIKNKIITAKELFLYVHENVERMSNGEQHPVMWENFSDNMIVMNWN